MMAAFSAALPDAVATLDPRGAILTANPAFCALVRRSAEEICGRSFGAIDGLGPTWSAIDTALSSSHTNQIHPALIDRNEIAIPREGQSDLSVEVSANLVLYGTSSYCVVTLRNISMRKSFEAAMIEERVAAEQAIAAKSDFVAMVAHEIRTAVNGVGGLLRMVEQEPDRARRSEFLKSAQRCSGSLLAIVGDILDLSKLEAGKFMIEPREFALTDLLSTIDAFWRPQVEENGLRFIVDRSGSAADIVSGDDLRLCQILHNYISNALKHTEHGEIRIAVSDLGAGQRRLTVSDTGSGIPTDEQKKLFRPFEQCSGSLATRLKGTGLGLAITRHIAEQMHGRAGVTSTVGEGSAFWVEVMLHDAAARRSAKDQGEPSSARVHGPFHVLAVEDNAINRLLLKAQLEARGHSVVFVETGQDAIDKATSTRFDGIILDMKLGDMRGDEAARAIRGSLADRSPPIICLTAFNTRSLGNAAIESFDLLFEKGLEPERFIEAVETAIERSLSGERERPSTIDLGCLQSIPVANRPGLLRLFAIELRGTLSMPRDTAPDELRRRCHALAATAANFGAKRVVSLARDLHRMADAASAADLRRQLDDAITETIDEIERFRSDPVVDPSVRNRSLV